MIHVFTRTLAAAAFCLLTATCSPSLTILQQVDAGGRLRMATVNSATTYYLAASGPTGFEYDLGRLFAESIGAELAVHVVPHRDAAVEAVRSGRAHFAAGLAVTPERSRRVRFTAPYFRVAQQLVVRSGRTRPASLAQFEGHLVVPAHTAIADYLARVHPDLGFTASPDTNSEELLLRVANGEIDATIADSNLIKLNQRYYPELRVAFTLDVQRELAWAFSRTYGGGLFNKAVAFFDGLADSAQMRVVQDRYFGHADRLGFVGGKTFARIVEERLHRWRDEFRSAGQKYGLDWRLLAAMGYQESHWNPRAVSFTGVRGLMMLTEVTARELGISDRTDPRESIDGGARYLASLRSKLPERIEEPDRTWMALAAYNVGLGHLMDARRILAAQGRNPDRWVNVRATLPLLTQERYHRYTRYGYARGHEAVAYVGNIRAYYDILLWMTSDTEMEMPRSLSGEPPETVPPGERALRIDTPAL